MGALKKHCDQTARVPLCSYADGISVLEAICQVNPRVSSGQSETIPGTDWLDAEL